MRRNRKLIYYCEVGKDGYMNLPRKRLKTEVEKSFAGKIVKVIIEEKHRPKSNEQLGYFYGVILPYICYGFIKAGNDIQIGNDKDEEMIEKFLKDKFLRNGDLLVDANQEVHEGPSSLAGSDVIESSDFIEACIQWGAEFLGIDIPKADPTYKDKTSTSIRESLINKLYGI